MSNNDKTEERLNAEGYTETYIPYKLSLIINQEKKIGEHKTRIAMRVHTNYLKQAIASSIERAKREHKDETAVVLEALDSLKPVVLAYCLGYEGGVVSYDAERSIA